jgi:hypothetical protein
VWRGVGFSLAVKVDLMALFADEANKYIVDFSDYSGFKKTTNQKTFIFVFML